VSLKITTHRGVFEVDAEQLFCVRPCKVHTPTGEVDGCEIVISLGVQPRPAHVVQENLARAIEQERGRRIILPPAGSKVDS
jgi:hypothetical protein